MEIVTTKCSAHGHAEVRMQVDTARVPEAAARQFMDGIEDMVTAGSRFSPGQTIAVGWSQAQVAEHASELMLLEPDMEAGLPIQYKQDVTRMLWQLNAQLSVLDSYGIARTEVNFASLSQLVVVCKRFHDAERLLMERDAPDAPRSSGWLFACTDPEHNHDGDMVEVITLYEAALRSQRVIPWLGLPLNTKVVLQDSVPARVLANGEELRLVDGSFVALGGHTQESSMGDTHFGFVGGMSLEEARKVQERLLDGIETDDVGAKVNAAAKLMLSGEFKSTIEAYRAISIEHPERLDECEGQIGAAHYLLGDYEQALHFYKEAGDHGADASMMKDNIDEAREAIRKRDSGEEGDKEDDGKEGGLLSILIFLSVLVAAGYGMFKLLF